VLPKYPWLGKNKDWRIVEIEGKLSTLYFTAHNSPAFDFYIDLQQKHRADPNQLLKGDFWATDLMNSNMFEKDIDAFVKEKGDASNLLTKLPQTVGLESDEGGRLIPEISRVIESIYQVKGFGISKATKVLCTRRPLLIPMLDSHVVECLTGREEAKDKSCATTEFLLRQFRQVLLFRDNLKSLRAAALQLARETSLKISPTRLLEQLIWFDWSFSGKKRKLTSTERWLQQEGWTWDGNYSSPYVHRIAKKGSS
jgi:hypothetical protein